jgi:hypothetical protein
MKRDRSARSMALGVIGWIALLGIAFILLRHALQTSGRGGYRRIMQADHPELLLACRELISNRVALSPDHASRDILPIGPKYHGYTNMVHATIQNLGPMFMEVHTNYVMIYVAMPPRQAVLGFAEGAHQFGTTKLIDGLWYWTGTDATR